MKKSYPLRASLLILVLAITVASKANAQRIDMSGAVGFDRYGSSVTLSASRIQNYASQGSLSGTLVLQLWATSMPYYGQGVLNGYKLAEANLGTLWGGYYLSNINRSVAFYEPPRGYYNTVLVLGEWNGYQYLTVDWCNLIGIKNFGGMPPYTPVPAPPALDLIDEYVGTWEGSQTLQINGSSYETTATSTISRYQNAGFYSKAYVRTPGQLVGEAEAWQYDNGTMYGVVKSQDSVIATLTGTWYISGRSIISNVSVVAGNTSYTQYINHSFPDGETMISSSSTSTGGSISGTAKKVLIPPKQTVAPPPAPGGAGGPAQVQKSKKGAKGKSSAKKSSGAASKKSAAPKSSGGKKSGGKKKKK